MIYMHLENNLFFYIIKNVNWFIVFQSYNLLLRYLILKINLSHKDPINYHVSNTFQGLSFFLSKVHNPITFSTNKSLNFVSISSH